MFNWWFGSRWFGILDIPLSNNPFHNHKEILGIQTTGTQTTNSPLVDHSNQINPPVFVQVGPMVQRPKTNLSAIHDGFQIHDFDLQCPCCAIKNHGTGQISSRPRVRPHPPSKGNPRKFQGNRSVGEIL